MNLSEKIEELELIQIESIKRVNLMNEKGATYEDQADRYEKEYDKMCVLFDESIDVLKSLNNEKVENVFEELL